MQIDDMKYTDGAEFEWVIGRIEIPLLVALDWLLLAYINLF